MNPEETQPEELTPEDAKAALGLSTRLSEQMLMAEAQPMEGQEAPEELELEEPKEDVRAIIKEEMENFKKEMLTILENEQEETTTDNN